MTREYALMMLIGETSPFDGYVYTWTPWSKDLEDMLIHNEWTNDAESVELALFALPEGYELDEDVSGALRIYDQNGYQAEIITDRKRRIYATDYPNKNKYFNKIETIWSREDGKKVYNNRIGRYAGRLDDATINKIYGTIAYDLGEKAACMMMTNKKLLTAYYLENVQLIAAKVPAVIQDAVLVHMYGDSYGNGDCILPAHKAKDFESDADVEEALRNESPINRYWEDDAGIMWECCEEDDENLLIDPVDGEED